MNDSDIEEIKSRFAWYAQFGKTCAVGLKYKYKYRQCCLF